MKPLYHLTEEVKPEIGIQIGLDLSIDKPSLVCLSLLLERDFTLSSLGTPSCLALILPSGTLSVQLSQLVKLCTQNATSLSFVSNTFFLHWGICCTLSLPLALLGELTNILSLQTNS